MASIKSIAATIRIWSRIRIISELGLTNEEVSDVNDDLQCEW